MDILKDKITAILHVPHLVEKAQRAKHGQLFDYEKRLLDAHGKTVVLLGMNSEYAAVKLGHEGQRDYTLCKPEYLITNDQP